MKEKVKKKVKSTAELTAGFEKLLAGKELNPSGKDLFEKVVKKASKPHGSK